MALLFANNNSLSAITSLPASISGGGMNLISTQTASSSSTISFTSGIDSTYDEYVFKFYDIHPATDRAYLQFQVDTGTNTNYSSTITSSYFHAFHNEADSNTALNYVTSKDQAQATGFQTISYNTGNANDECSVGQLHLFSPSSTTFVKIFISKFQTADDAGFSDNPHCAGYINTTTALTRVQFKMSSGTFDGVIKLYGIS